MTKRTRNKVAEDLRKASHALEIADDDTPVPAIKNVLIEALFRLTVHVDAPGGGADA